MNKIASYIFLISLFFFDSLLSQNKINWISFEQMEAFQKKEKRPVLIDAYTDWCGWCKRLDATTYADPNIISYINRNFYAIKFNAETHDTITFQGKKYMNPIPSSNKSTHDLAKTMMGNNLSYPTTIYLDNEMKPTIVVPGYFDANQILPFLVFHAEQLNLNSNINDFENDFKKAFSQDHNDSTHINWISMEEAVELQKKTPKKIFVHLKNSTFVSDRVMSASTFEATEVIKELNNYYCVEIDVLAGDTVFFQNHTYINPSPGKNVHQIAFGLLQNQVGFPSVVIINEQALVLAPIKQYLTEKHLAALLKYFHKNTYLTKSFPDYIKENYK
jgi:thioredoxin-related protein